VYDAQNNELIINPMVLGFLFPGHPPLPAGIGLGLHPLEASFGQWIDSRPAKYVYSVTPCVDFSPAQTFPIPAVSSGKEKSSTHPWNNSRTNPRQEATWVYGAEFSGKRLEFVPRGSYFP
jgi:hypothetical protein